MPSDRLGKSAPCAFHGFTLFFFRYLESLSVSLAKEQRWMEAVHFGRQACTASEEEAGSLCSERLRPSATCIEAKLSSSCLMLAIMLRDGNFSLESTLESETIFGKILALGKRLFQEAQMTGVSMPPSAARTACR